MAIVSAMETSGIGVNTDPQEPQKRLLSNISVEHVGEQSFLWQMRIGVDSDSDSEAGGFHGRHDGHGAAAHAYRAKQFLTNLGAEFTVLRIF